MDAVDTMLGDLQFILYNALQAAHGAQVLTTGAHRLVNDRYGRDSKNTPGQLNQGIYASNNICRQRKDIFCSQR